MKLTLILLLTLIISSQLFAQDFSGKWEGILTQKGNKDFYFNIEFIQENGKITGESFIKYQDKSNPTGKFTINGLFNGDELLISETKQLTRGNWCIKNYKLSPVQQQDGTYLLEGPWCAKNCASGYIKLKKIQSPKRPPFTYSSNNELSGIWVGKLQQEDKNYDFYYQVNIPDFETNQHGTSFIVAEINNGGSATHLLEYSYIKEEERVLLKEYQIVYRDNKRWLWCVKEANLKLTRYPNKLVLSGTWKPNDKSEGSYCYPGTLTIEKPILAKEEKVTEYKDDRKLTIAKKFEVTSTIISMEFWDHGKVDNDTVSIYLNNKIILNKVMLEKKHKSIEINLTEDKNYFIFHAENLGTVPPNTAAFKIKYDGKEEKVILNSNLHNSGAILFERKK